MKRFLEFGLAGKKVLVTGASSGLGASIAKGFAESGACVFMAARRLERLEALQEEITKAGGDAQAVYLDMSKKEMFSDVVSSLGPFDILINNAGVFRQTGPFDQHTDETFEEVLRINFTNTWHLTRCVVASMKEHGVKGSIVSIASVNGDITPGIGTTAYDTSKAALVHLTYQLSRELSPYGIRCNVVCPGLFRTEMTENYIEGQEESIAKSIPLGKIGEPEELTPLVLLLSSNALSSFTTGAKVVVDGGGSWTG